VHIFTILVNFWEIDISPERDKAIIKIGQSLNAENWKIRNCIDSKIGKVIN